MLIIILGVIERKKFKKRREESSGIFRGYGFELSARKLEVSR